MVSMVFVFGWLCNAGGIKGSVVVVVGGGVVVMIFVVDRHLPVASPLQWSDDG